MRMSPLPLSWKTDTTIILSQAWEKSELKRALTFNYSSLAAININLNIERSLISIPLLWDAYTHTYILVKHYATFTALSAAIGDVFAYTFKRHTPEPGRESHANTHNSYSAALGAYSQRAKRDRPTTMYDFTHTHTLSTLLAISRWVIYEQLHHFARAAVTSDLCLSAGAVRF